MSTKPPQGTSAPEPQERSERPTGRRGRRSAPKGAQGTGSAPAAPAAPPERPKGAKGAKGDRGRQERPRRASVRQEPERPPAPARDRCALCGTSTRRYLQPEMTEAYRHEGGVGWVCVFCFMDAAIESHPDMKDELEGMREEVKAKYHAPRGKALTDALEAAKATNAEARERARSLGVGA